MPSFQLAMIDWLVIVTYAIVVLFIGLKLSSKEMNVKEYFLVGNMTWPFIGLSLFASNISSTTLVGLAGSAYSGNIAVYNYEWMAVLVLIIFAIFLLPFYLYKKKPLQKGSKHEELFTIPEFLERRFDARSRYYFSVLTLFLNIVVDTAGTLYAGGLVMKLIFPEVPLWESIAILALMAGIYTIAGGLAAVIYTDAVQAILLLTTSVIVTFITLSQVGGWESVVNQIPAQDLNLIQPLDDPNLPWLGLIGVFLLGFYFWATNQFITQRVLSAKNVNHGRWGVLFAGLLKLPVLFIMVLPGVMARLLYPDLPNPDLVYPTLLFDLLPVGLLGLAIAGLIAALMSSIDSTLNSASTLVTMDFVHKFYPQINSKQLTWIGRITTLLFMLLAIAWAPQIEKFEGLFKYLQQVLAYAVSPVVAVFFLGIFWRRANQAGAFAALIAGLVVGTVLFMANVVWGWTSIHFLYIAPILFMVSLIVGIIVSLLTPAPQQEQLVGCMWSIEFYQAETQELRKLPWYQNYRILSLLLIILTAGLIGKFW